MRKIYSLIIILSFLIFSGLACERQHYDLGIYKSSDGGATWQQKIKIGKKKVLATQEVLSLAVDPLNSDIIYAGTKGKGVYKSFDGGEQWQKISLTLGEVTSVIIDPKDSNILYVASYVGEFGKIYKSEDGGNKFEEIYSETHQQIPVFTLALDWYDTRKIWAGTEQGAVLKSEDSGRNWEVKKWLNNEVVQIAISSKDSRHVIVGTRSDGLWKTEDEGKTWKDINDTVLKGEKKVESRQKLKTHSLVFDFNKRGAVYFASQYQLLKSGNEGKTWKEIPLLVKPGEALLARIALDPFDLEKIYLALNTTIYRSDDGGKNWKVSKITNGRIAALTLDPKNPEKIYAGIRKPKE